MRIALVALLFAASAFAQNRSAALPAACGPKNVSFDLQLVDSKRKLVQPDPGKAIVYFIQDNGFMDKLQHLTLKIGMDGAWIGAYKKNSYFTVSVEPGEHHVCANVQSHFSAGQLLALSHFTAVPGQVYYFHTQLFPGEVLSMPIPPFVSFNQIDSDEAKYLIASDPLSVSQPRK